MYFNILLFLLGCISLQAFAVLPKLSLLIIIAVILFVFSHKKIIQCLLIVLLGLIWITYYAMLIKAWQLPEKLINKPVTINGYIQSLPQIKNQATRFEFVMQALNNKPQHTKLLLTWYNAPTNLQVGDRWQLLVKLKMPDKNLMPGRFDYAKWLFAHQICALGYVINAPVTQPLQSAWHWQSINQIRQNLSIKIKSNLINQSTTGLIIALVTGSQNDITESQWQVMRATGTNHLMAIAGLHVGFISGFAYFLIQFLWRRSVKLMYFMASPQAAAIGALIVAILYSTLAGFALPTQRALIMMSAVMLALILRKNFSTWHGFYLALFIILLIDPLVTLTISFWLSFAAVALILYGLTGRVGHASSWYQWGKIQWILTLGLFPLTIWLFNQASLISFFANSIAVPVVGFLVLPLCALGTLSLYIFPLLAHWLLLIAAKILVILWSVLNFLADLKDAVWIQAMPNHWILITSLIGIVLLLAPRGYPARWLGIFWLLPLFFYPAHMPANNSAWITALPVRSGMAIIIQTHNHLFVYDVDDKQRDNLNNNILPYLQYSQIKKIDWLVLYDKQTNVENNFANIKIDQPLTDNLTKEKPNANLMNWQWDGINFDLSKNQQKQFMQTIVVRSDKQSILIVLKKDRNSLDVIKQNNLSHLAQALILPVSVFSLIKNSEGINFYKYIIVTVSNRQNSKFNNENVLTNLNEIVSLVIKDDLSIRQQYSDVRFWN